MTSTEQPVGGSPDAVAPPRRAHSTPDPELPPPEPNPNPDDVPPEERAPVQEPTPPDPPMKTRPA